MPLTLWILLICDASSSSSKLWNKQPIIFINCYMYYSCFIYLKKMKAAHTHTNMYSLRWPDFNSCSLSYTERYKILKYLSVTAIVWAILKDIKYMQKRHLGLIISDSYTCSSHLVKTADLSHTNADCILIHIWNNSHLLQSFQTTGRCKWCPCYKMAKVRYRTRLLNWSCTDTKKVNPNF